MTVARTIGTAISIDVPLSAATARESTPKVTRKAAVSRVGGGT